jgi:hypothetical protein
MSPNDQRGLSIIIVLLVFILTLDTPADTTRHNQTHQLQNQERNPLKGEYDVSRGFLPGSRPNLVIIQHADYPFSQNELITASEQQFKPKLTIISTA